MSLYSATYDYIPKIIEDKIQCIFDNIYESRNASKLCIKKFLKFEDGSLQKGDFSIILSSLSVVDNANITEKLKSELIDIMDNCYSINGSRLKLVLNRAKCFSYCLKQAIMQKVGYGFLTNGSTKNILIFVHNTNSNQLLSFRTITLAQHLLSIALNNNYKVYCDKNVPISSSCSNFIQYELKKDLDLEAVYALFEAKISNLKWLVSPDDVPQYIRVECPNDALVLNGRKYLLESENGHLIYDKNIGYIPLKYNAFTQCFKDSAMIDYVLEHEATDVDVILHVVPLKKRFSVQQSGLVIDMLNVRQRTNHYIVHQQIVVKGRQDITPVDLMSIKYREMEQALIHKYGNNIMNEDSWVSIVKILAETALTFDFLLTRYSTPLKIDTGESKQGLQDKGGAFVQYNCSRLATLFRNFNRCVESGKYDPLPDIEDIDFTQLKMTEEWQIFYNYVLQFPRIMTDLSESMDVSICSHKICQMLVNLSREFSVYYNKCRVLVEPFPALVPQMYARLYLLQGVHQVLKNGLLLLNLPAVEKM